MASPRRPTPRPGPPPIEHALAYSRTSGARGGRGLSSGGGVPSCCVTRSPESQPCRLRAGRGGPTPPEGTPPPDATRPVARAASEFVGQAGADDRVRRLVLRCGECAGLMGLFGLPSPGVERDEAVCVHVQFGSEAPAVALV